MAEPVQLGGSGNPVLLIHGFGADKQTFLGNVSSLAEVAQVWAVDLPAHGAAATETPELGLTGLLSQLEQSISSLPVLPLHIVGHSVGGALAIMLAAKHPHTSGMSLIAPMGLGQGVSGEFLKAFPTLRDTDSVIAQLSQLVYDKRLISPLVAPVVLDQLNFPGVRRSLTSIGHSLLSESFVELNRAIEQIKQKNIPRQIFWGREDSINPFNIQDKETFGGQWQVIGNCGHLPHIEHRIRFNRAVVSLIDEIADSSEV